MKKSKSLTGNFPQARILAAQEDWRKEIAKSTQEEIDRALSTARKAWAVKADEKFENRVREIEANVRQQLEAKIQEENKKNINEALREAEERFSCEKRKLEENFKQKVSLLLCADAPVLVCFYFCQN